MTSTALVDEAAPVGNAVAEGPAQSLERRELLVYLARIGAGGLAAALAASAPGAPAFASTAAAARNVATKRKFRYGMVIDTRRCVGCRACVVACKAENKTPPGVSYTVVVEQALGNRPDDKPLFMTKPCFHCENPPCSARSTLTATGRSCRRSRAR